MAPKRLIDAVAPDECSKTTISLMEIELEETEKDGNTTVSSFQLLFEYASELVDTNDMNSVELRYCASLHFPDELR